jgi:23S rRNA (uridine2552-2'-O)-methyltransferase
MRRSPRKQGTWEDHYSRKAKKERFPARSVYKLEEIQQRYRLIRKGNRILDLGCFPGSWLLYAAGLVGETGRVAGIDLKAVTIRMPPHVKTLTGDILAGDGGLPADLGRNFDGVLSDMAPATTGIKHVDSARSYLLCETALSIAADALVTGGFFVCKIFQGMDFKAFTDAVRDEFQKHSIFKPKSSRKGSKEIYIIGIKKKG